MSLALRDAKFELDASTAVSPNVVDRVGGMVFTNWPVSTDTDGVSFWNLDSSYLQRTGGGVLQESQAYTHAFVLKWRVSNSGWRTLLRHSFGHCVITRDGYRDLGVYSNRAGGFRDSGYDISPQREWWDVVVATGQGASATSPYGTTELYTKDGPHGPLVKRGSVDRVCSGSNYYRLGHPGQGPGLISRVVSWSRVLQDAEIQTLGGLTVDGPGRTWVEGISVTSSASFKTGMAIQLKGRSEIMVVHGVESSTEIEVIRGAFDTAAQRSAGTDDEINILGSVDDLVCTPNVCYVENIINAAAGTNYSSCDGKETGEVCTVTCDEGHMPRRAKSVVVRSTFPWSATATGASTTRAALCARSTLFLQHVGQHMLQHILRHTHRHMYQPRFQSRHQPRCRSWRLALCRYQCLQRRRFLFQPWPGPTQHPRWCQRRQWWWCQS